MQRFLAHPQKKNLGMGMLRRDLPGCFQDRIALRIALLTLELKAKGSQCPY